MKTVMLYKGTVRVDFDEAKHRYLVNGERKDSVTTFLKVINKPALIPQADKETVGYVRTHLEDLKSGKIILEQFNHYEILYGASREADRKRDHAAEIGTAIHKQVEQYIKRQSPEMPDDPVVLNGVNAFLKWKEEHHVKPSKSEKFIYSQKHDYVGITDIIAEVDGSLCICVHLSCDL